MTTTTVDQNLLRRAAEMAVNGRDTSYTRMARFLGVPRAQVDEIMVALATEGIVTRPRNGRCEVLATSLPAHLRMRP